MTLRTGRSSTVPAIVVGALFVLALGSCDADGPPETTPAPSPSAEGSVPPFRFAVSARRIETTHRAPLGRRDRRRVQDVLDEIRGRVTDLYVAGFLDAGRWRTGDYDPVFDLFAGGARDAARARVAALTAGPDAVDRFTAIRPAGGRIALRALLDRSGAATLVSSVVRFRARADGDEPTLLWSEATYLFRRTEHGWRIVAFHVVRRDRERAA